MRRVFADAGLLDCAPESEGRPAREGSRDLRHPGVDHGYMTSEMVLTEVLNAFAGKGELLRKRGMRARRP